VARAADGAVFVYLQPLAADAARITIALASVHATGTSGTDTVLHAAGSIGGRADAPRQQLVASGRVPAASYAGITLRVARATFRSGRKEIALAVGDDTIRVDFPFSVAAGGPATTIWLTLDADEPALDTPQLSVRVTAAAPVPPIGDYTGFATSSKGGTVTVFDKRLGLAAAVLGGCQGAAGLALDQLRRRLFVACARDDEIQAIDVAHAAPVDRARAMPGDHPHDLALTPDGQTLLAVNPDSNSLTFYDALTLARQERVAVGSGPGAVVVDSTGRRAFVLNTFSSSITVIDVPGRAVVATLATEPSPTRAAFSGAGDRLYVIHQRSPWMTVLDPRQLTVITRVRVPIGTSAIALDTARNLVCLGSDDPSIDFYDPNALLPVLSMRAGAGVSFLDFDRDGNRLFMVVPGRGSVRAATLGDRRLAWEIDVGDAPYAVAVMGER
jgi:YVTN family beta-propeller protein